MTIRPPKAGLIVPEFRQNEGSARARCSTGSRGAPERGSEGAPGGTLTPGRPDASAARCRQQQQDRGRVQQERHYEDKQAQHVLVGPAQQGGEVFHGAEIGLDLGPFAIGRGLLDLEGGYGLGFPDPLASEIGTVPALLLGELHGRGGAAAGGGLLTAVSIWAIRRSKSATTPALTPRRAPTSAPRPLVWKA